MQQLEAKTVYPCFCLQYPLVAPSHVKNECKREIAQVGIGRMSDENQISGKRTQ